MIENQSSGSLIELQSNGGYNMNQVEYGDIGTV